MENAAAAGSAGTAVSAPSGPVWRFLVTPRWIGWHLLMVVTFWGMVWLGDWQLRRALSGNGLSWAYTFEWPLFACFAVVFWAKTIRDEFRIRRGEIAPPGGGDLPAGTAEAVQVQPVQAVRAAGAGGAGGAAQAAGAGDDEDEELSAYNAYLARLNAEVRRRGPR
jgi:hypothetical protein